MKYIFFGTSEFAAIILKTLITKNLTPVAIVTQPDRAAGRGKKLTPPPVKMIAQQHRIPLLQPEKLDTNFLKDIAHYHADLFVVAAYGEILKKEVLDFPPRKTINVHPSLLPKYRGPSPIQTAIMNGDEQTGVSIMLLDDAVDHGPILAQTTTQISTDDTTMTLSEKLALQSAELLAMVIPQWGEQKLAPVAQDDTQATFTRMITKEDGHIDWTTSAAAIERHTRAMAPWPGSWTMWKYGEKTIRLQCIKVTSRLASLELRRSGPGSGKNAAPGTVLDDANDCLVVACGDGVLAIELLQPEGKQTMTARAFVNGHPTIIGAVLK
ncbi:methionyl-tRNA formyltransferase [Candidatus Uhrbacteria bacterium]|nr:methionyl-tRNA formyltransferase [Candidatus Uhrbacteria bacterium]